MPCFEHWSKYLGIEIPGYHGYNEIFTSCGFEEYLYDKNKLLTYVALDPIIIMVDQNSKYGRNVGNTYELFLMHKLYGLTHNDL